MGIKGLTKLLADNAPNAMKEQKLENYFGRKIAVDASLSIYQFLIVVGRTGTEMLTNEAGEVTSHLQGMLSRTIRLLEAGLKPVYVFDGKPPLLKSQELVKRYSKRANATEDLNKAIEAGNQEEIEKFSKRTVKVTKQHNDDCKKLLKLMGVPVIEAPSEAEAQCAALCKADKVYAVASEDMDSLTFGAPRFLRHLMDPSSRKIPVMEFDVSKVLEELNLTMDQFIDLCILSGCDYCDSIRGIGGQTALKLIRQHGSIEKILENINKERYQIPDDWPYEEARRLFNEPAVLSDEEQLEIKWTAPDEEGLINFLVNENGFNSDRITKAIEKIKAATNKSSQGRLESFFNLTCNTSAPIKRKGMEKKVLWILSSACSIHMTGDRALLSHFEEKVGPHVTFADGSKRLIKGYGKFESGNVIIEDVAQVEGLKQNFLSVGQFIDKDFIVHFNNGSCQITHNQTGKLALSGVVKGGVYVVDLDSVEKDNPTVF